MIVAELDDQEIRGSWEVARRLGGGRAPCWLTSPGPGELGLRCEYLACDPVLVLRDPSLPALEEAWREARAAWSAGPETPVAVGYFSYDLGRAFERIRGNRPAPADWPEIEVRFYDAFWVHAPARGRSEIWATSQAAAEGLRARLAGPPLAPEQPLPTLEKLEPLEPPARYLQGVARVLDYLVAGDAYQVNLARRLGARCRAEGPLGLELFARLQSVAPAPHALWLGDEVAGRALIGNSPERFLRREVDGWISTAPIKGTRPRGLAGELIRSDKDRAEHVMIVDLERNDLGRICETGSVEVVDPLRLLSLPSVHHLVSTVRGRLRPGLGLEAILRATFPGGSITGAPKLRAMEIIDELESTCRGPYTGATGWLGAAGDFDLAIAIRTALLRQEELTLWVGGGIVADSVPQAELDETEVKARAFAALVDPNAQG